jgi:hypothetical protein
MRYDSICVICQRPARSPGGNYNANDVTLCKRAKCQRQRKTDLQRARRRQKLFAFARANLNATSPGDTARIKVGTAQRELAASKASTVQGSRVRGGQRNPKLKHQLREKQLRRK